MGEDGRGASGWMPDGSVVGPATLLLSTGRWFSWIKSFMLFEEHMKKKGSGSNILLLPFVDDSNYESQE
jgi:hypothetical protein